MWQLYKNNKINCSQIFLRPSTKSLNEERANHKYEQLKDWDNQEADGYRYYLDLGNPIIQIKSQDLAKDEIIDQKREILKTVINLERENIMYRNFGVSCFKEIKNNQTDLHYFRHGLEYKSETDPSYAYSVYESLRIPLISLLCSLHAQGSEEKCDDLKRMITSIPDNGTYAQLVESNPTLFGFLKDYVDTSSGASVPQPNY